MADVEQAVCIGWQAWHLSEKMIFGQRSEEDERMNHSEIQGSESHTEGILSLKAQRWEWTERRGQGNGAA